ncbi:hypothetical protein [Actinoplanes sp. NPDC049316]|uniref:hypothetical protein n=1 Tax=Actinoplanes sp. NPDC049316 TaxID=3154727 RepID=UPI00343DA79E
MKGAAAFLGSGVMVVFPIPGDDIDRDALIAAALPGLEDIAARAGGTCLGPSTWRVINDAAELDGWDHWPGALLVATAPASTVLPGLRHRERRTA